MKKLSKLLLLVALFISTSYPAWSQTSTQGKEFWVSLIPSQDPENTGKGFDPYIAISSLKACVVTISNPNTGWSIVENIAKESWKQIYVPQNQWYVTNNTSKPAGETPLNYGLKVEATEEISVYCSLRWQQSFDATNILPTTALQSEYIIQTYGTTSASNGYHHCLFGILAAEDCVVDITPSVATESGRPANTTFNVSLQKGQTYYVMSATDQDLSGSHIQARNNKKIAVFVGSPAARIPNDVSDRDLLYEQIFPIDYWGKEFIIARSARKDANRVIITAQEDNTQVTIYGQCDPSTAKTADHTIQQNYTFTLNARQSYEFEMSAGYENGRWDSKRENFSGITMIDSTVYIKTSCPCAVMSYDTGNSYKRKDQTELNTKNNDGKNWLGAPAMTWVSPIEQMISEIVFGVMGTDMTTVHYVNVIVNTSDVPTTTLNGRSLSAYFKPVDSNKAYSYARIKLTETDPDISNPFYHLESKYGFVATVYGNGDDESYAYSVGSSAVKRAISVDGYKFTNEMPADEVKQTYCINEPLLFNPQIGTDVIDTVKWDFGDGTTAKTTIDDGIEIEHMYYTPGWYDITAKVYAHKECPFSSYPAEDISFSFYVNRPDTIFKLDTLCLEKGDESRQSYYDTVKFDCDSVVVTRHLVMHKADTAFRMEGNDKAVIHGKTYYDSRTVIDMLRRRDPDNRGCDSIVTIELIIRKCLNLQVPNDSVNQHTCFGSSIRIPYTYATGGQPGDVRIVRLNDMREFSGYMEDEPGQGVQPRTAGMFTFNTSEWEPGLYKAKVYLEDLYCKPEGADKGESESGVIDIAIYYPGDIFDYRFNNVLAVFKKGYGGNGANNPAYAGADFDTFEWHLVRNEIDAIVGANASVYYNGDPFLENDTVYVRLKETTKNYMLPSCSQTITVVPDFTPEEQQQAPAAQKRLVNNRMVIIKDDCTYNMYGQRVQ